ncbi:RNA polymerase sigma factor [Chitinophaga sancti]|uniref:RNA polymerase sigma-70 factor n=1 Tax=Chitinophaga sancti TaxID=1004 RepID=A0A1K1S394_9BACT|nr:RNA polymerase sigma-70 factor [Chitinophaga sancti]WQD59646.1 RNA polymerase sigma-70 factor [Chitinophaga sancti]WQG88223.1 RNA polymerase sigma-70 factor [Chitinophaga sancti]SFW78493.1 RNA polymerase sigma-70 factor, Bacteroides expansion family 1 [Chitinophaga sancti]
MQNLSSYNDEQLFLLLQANSEEAFNVIFERYRKRLFLEAYSRLQQEEESNDIVQEVFLWLWNKRATLQIGDCLKPYLVRVVRNKVVDHLRKCNSARNHRQYYTWTADTETSKLPIENKELGQQLEDAMNSITPASRLAFEQLYLQDKSLREIAVEMDINVQSVKNHIHRALKILRKNLKHRLS